jgi:FixJ family two-component response regulator
MSPAPRPALTPRTRQVLGLLIAGLAQKAVPHMLGISDNMVAYCLARARHAYRAATTYQLIAIVVSRGEVRVEDR